MVGLRYPSPVALLAREIQGAIAQVYPSSAVGVPPIRRVPNSTSILYGSPVALQLARQWQCPPLEMAQQLLALLWEQRQLYSVSQGLDPLFEGTVTLRSPGWLVWSLPDCCVAAWLAQIPQSPLGLPPTTLTPPDLKACTSESLEFQLHYAHARCCSLLRLGHRQGLIQLWDPEPPLSLSHWAIQSPQSLPWLTAEQQLRLVHPAERALIYQLLEFPLPWLAGGPLFPDTLDDPWSLTPVSPPLSRLTHQARALGETFQTFYRRCQIGGEAHNHLEQSQSRLGLVLAVRPLFHFLIQALWGNEALVEL